MQTTRRKSKGRNCRMGGLNMRPGRRGTRHTSEKTGFAEPTKKQKRIKTHKGRQRKKKKKCGTHERRLFVKNTALKRLKRGLKDRRIKDPIDANQLEENGSGGGYPWQEESPSARSTRGPRQTLWWKKQEGQHLKMSPDAEQGKKKKNQNALYDKGIGE